MCGCKSHPTPSSTLEVNIASRRRVLAPRVQGAACVTNTGRRGLAQTRPPQARRSRRADRQGPDREGSHHPRPGLPPRRLHHLPQLRQHRRRPAGRSALGGSPPHSITRHPRTEASMDSPSRHRAAATLIDRLSPGGSTCRRGPCRPLTLGAFRRLLGVADLRAGGVRAKPERPSHGTERRRRSSSRRGGGTPAPHARSLRPGVGRVPGDVSGNDAGLNGWLHHLRTGG
jgi:hypothetical protein